ncbi:MAG: PH domain-containing protein, partial [Planctomycetota bacterium]
MTGNQRTFTVGALGSLLITVAAAADVVERRGAAPVIEGEVTVIDDAGVTVRSPLGAVHFVAWDRVRRVETERERPELQKHWETAVDLWRARSRVERNDTTLAEPLLERLFERYRGRTHETALVVAEGLLRCRIARADHVLAIVPALEVARLRRAGVKTEAYANLAPVFDSDYGL